MTFNIRLSGDPVLKMVCSPVERGEDLSFVPDMRRVLRTLDGVGLAAPQIGVPKQVILVRNRILINPVIYWQSKIESIESEGCLSYPGILKKINRPISAKVKFLDEAWIEHDEQFTYFECRILLHEVDHLSGVCRVGDN